MQALICEAREAPSQAEAYLGRAVALAHPRGFIRLFVDMGPAMPRLLNRLELAKEPLQYIGKIQAAFRGAGSPPAFPAVDTPAADLALRTRSLLDPFTNREQEVLGLLAGNLTNLEIAEHLHISVGTVKRHTNSLNRKIGVHGRREAVAKARGLGMLPYGPGTRVHAGGFWPVCSKYSRRNIRSG